MGYYNAMEPNNTQSRLRNIIAPLLRVTRLSKALAMLVFIALPFLGGFVGYRSAPEKIVYIETSTETSQEANDGWDEVIKQYQAAYNTDRVLEFLFRADSDTEIVYFQSVGATSACCGVIGYNQGTKSFFETDAYADGVSGEVLSPSGKLIAQLRDDDAAHPSLEIYDIEAKAVIKRIDVDSSESLWENKCGYGGGYASFTWLDNETISYGVYKELSQDSETACEMKFVEYRYDKVR